jgi:hypothetical protein
VKSPQRRHMAADVVKGLLYFFAIIAAITGVLAFSIGVQLVPGAGRVPPSVDNEFRFFSVFWLTYGCYCAFVARRLTYQRKVVPALALIMFVAGLARMMSTVLVGRPADLYFYGAAIELTFPFGLYFAYRSMSSA